MGQALYRKYRTKTFAETLGQEHVTTTLSNAIKQGKISHAYLLTGPRGVGKTSIARILAHEINGLAYDDENHLDIIEIDAASNRRIDEIRDLRDRVNTAPASAKYKVYIIDEVHMLTKEAFNALLKTLEEPPAHVVFILATTESHKLPDTIVSRTQRYTFRPVPQAQVVAHLRHIADAENIVIDDEALELIAEHGEGSFRDSISLLDQVSSVGTRVLRKDVEQTLGLASDELIGKLQLALMEDVTAKLISTLSELFALGFEPAAIASQLAASVRNAVIDGQSTDPGRDLVLLKALLDVPAARSGRQLLEITLLQAIDRRSNSRVATEADRPEPAPVMVGQAQPAAEKRPKTVVAEPALEPIKAVEPIEESPTAEVETVEVAAKDTAMSETEPLEDVSELWQATLGDIKKQYNTLYGIARMAQVELKGDQLVLTLKFAFHQKRLNEAKNRKIFAEVVERLYGKPLEIICIVGEPVLKAASEKPSDISAISNIFGGAELLQ